MLCRLYNDRFHQRVGFSPTNIIIRCINNDAWNMWCILYQRRFNQLAICAYQNRYLDTTASALNERLHISTLSQAAGNPNHR